MLRDDLRTNRGRVVGQRRSRYRRRIGASSSPVLAGSPPLRARCPVSSVPLMALSLVRGAGEIGSVNYRPLTAGPGVVRSLQTSNGSLQESLETLWHFSWSARPCD